MQQRKIIGLLKCFSKAELKAFSRFIRSPFFNDNKRLIQLFDYIYSFSPDFSHPKMNEQIAYQKIFGEDVYQEKRLVRLLSKLCKLVDAFIGHYALQQNPEVGYSFRLNFYEKRNQNLFLEQQLKSFRQWLEENMPTHHRYNHARFKLEKTQSNFLHRQQQYNKDDVNLQEAMDALDHYYLVEKLMLATSMYNRQAILPISYHTLFLENMMEELKANFDHFSPTVRIWYWAFCMVKEPNSTEIYVILKNELLSKLDEIDESDGLALFFFLQNSVHKAIGQQSPIYFQELFELYEVQINQNWILSQNGTMLLNVFKNIVTVSTTLGRIAWTKAFIESYQDHLVADTKEEILGYAHALIEFKEKNYPLALKAIAQISPKNIFLTLSMRRLQLKIFYEQQEFEPLASAINAYRVYLHRLNRLSDRHKEVNITFLNFLSALVRLTESVGTATKMLAFKDEIQRSPLLPERMWLLEKVAELLVVPKE